MTAPSLGVLLVNLGTPDAPTPRAIKHYLTEFLSDHRIVSLWPPLWKLLLHTFILPLRAKKTAALYQKIWQPLGSPLTVNSRQQAFALEHLLTQKNESIKVILGMRYGSPSIAAGLAALQQLQVKKIIILPLYPQYSSTTTASVFDKVNEVLGKHPEIPDVHFISAFPDNTDYIDALAKHIEAYWALHGKGEKLLLSFHGLPLSLIQKGDPYAAHCYLTSTLLAQRLQLSTTDYEVVFQSRFGLQKWQQPYCQDRLRQLAAQGCKQVDVVCPGFVADCLETLEEMAIANNKIFIQAGGKSLHYIPALNANVDFIEALTKIIAPILLERSFMAVDAK